MASFDDVKATFWDDGTHWVQPPLTEMMVEDAERLLEVRLPPAFLEFLRVRNGGGVAPAWDAFPAERPTSWAEDHVPVDHIMGIGEPGGMTTLLDTPYLVQEWGMPSPIVLLTGGGHYWIGLDYRACGREGEPSVTWFDTDFGTELPLAADFRSFVEGLTASSTFNV
jgi:hypothetical protein